MVLFPVPPLKDWTAMMLAIFDRLDLSSTSHTRDMWTTLGWLTKTSRNLWMLLKVVDSTLGLLLILTLSELDQKKRRTVTGYIHSPASEFFCG